MASPNLKKYNTVQAERLPLTMKVLAIGLPRAGSSSMTEALRILGYPQVYHLGKIPLVSKDYDFFNKAAETYFPSLPGYKGGALTREEWDSVFGTWEGVADIGGVFAPQLAEAYPEAKVVLLHRPFEKWAKSFKDLMEIWSTPLAYVNQYFSEPLLGSKRQACISNMAVGFVGASNWAGVFDDEKLRWRYDIHYEAVRRVVPKERLFEMDLGDGWEGLCEFLGKEVPDVPFPRSNKGEDLKVSLPKQHWVNTKKALLNVVAPWVGCAVAVTAGMWWLCRTVSFHCRG